LASTSLPQTSNNCTITVHSGQWANSLADEQFHMRNILYDDCDSFSYHPHTATYWLAPAQTAASLILDLGCVQVVEELIMKNTLNSHLKNRGLNQFKVWLSNSTAGPWREVLDGSLPDARLGNSTCSVPLTTFQNKSLTEEALTGRALKLEVVSWYGAGAGLQYLKLVSRPPACGVAQLLGSVLLVALALALAGLAWLRRDRLRGLWAGRAAAWGPRVAFTTQQSQQPMMVDVDLK
jgi:hypothetical protein